MKIEFDHGHRIVFQGVDKKPEFEEQMAAERAKYCDEHSMYVCFKCFPWQRPMPNLDTSLGLGEKECQGDQK